MRKRYGIGFLVATLLVVLILSIADRNSYSRIQEEYEQEEKTRTQGNVETYYYIKENEGYVIVYEADEKTVEAINNYREWASTVADFTQQFEELNTEIASLAKQKLDNITDHFDNKLGIYENIESVADAHINEIEELGYVASAKSYEYMEKAARDKAVYSRFDQSICVDEGG